MDAHLPKPIRIKELENLLEQVRSRHGVAGGRLAAAGHAGASPAVAVDHRSSIRRRLAELAGPDPDDDRELFAELLRSFASSSLVQLAELRQAVEQQVAHDVEHRAHSLKGSAANLGGDDLALVLQGIEQAGRDGRLSGLDDDLERAGAELLALNLSIVSLADELAA
jgi:HPt (histidine-containing phosphotransfer) domain-containing protein